MSLNRTFSPGLLLLLLVNAVAIAQPANSDRPRTPFSTDLQAGWLQEVLPTADSFSAKAGDPPVYQGFRTNGNGDAELVGYAFFSADLPPEEKGYSYPIAMLIGMNLELKLTGIKLLDYRESFRYSRGDFAADANFQNQFRNKPIADEFRLGSDIDGLSGATLTSFGISRGAREAARRVAAAYLDFEAGDARARASAVNAREQLDRWRWEDLVAQGVIRQATIPMPLGELELSITYMGRPVLGEYLVGSEDYAEAERYASTRLGGPDMILVAVGGSAAPQFRQERLSLRDSNGAVRQINQRLFVSAGGADAGVIAGHAAYAGAIVLDADFDVTAPFGVAYLPQGQIDPVIIPYQLSGLGLALARNEAIPSLAEMARAERMASGFMTRLAFGPPWMNTLDTDTPWEALPWGKIVLLLVLFALSLSAFFTKQAGLRWVALGATLVYLGIIDGGFLSVSHMTSVIEQGPGQILNNLPLSMLVVFTLVTTLLWGRIFCSSLCPFGALQDIITRLTPRHWQHSLSRVFPRRWHERLLYVKYAVLALILVVAVAVPTVSIFQYAEPFGTLFFLSASMTLWSILLVILLGCMLIPRFYCRYLCPLGAALGVLSLVSPLRIKRVSQCEVCHVCELVCPTGAIQGSVIDFKECVRCDLCEKKLLVRAGSCRHSPEEIKRRRSRELFIAVGG